MSSDYSPRRRLAPGAEAQEMPQHESEPDPTISPDFGFWVPIEENIEGLSEEVLGIFQGHLAPG